MTVFLCNKRAFIRVVHFKPLAIDIQLLTYSEVVFSGRGRVKGAGEDRIEEL